MSTQKQSGQQQQQQKNQQQPQGQNTQQNTQGQQPQQQNQQQQQQQMQQSQQNQQYQQQQQQMQQSQIQQQKQTTSSQKQPTKLQEKKNSQAMENAELNEYIKSYLKFNTFQNTLECFEAEINAKRMSSKLQDKKLLKDPNVIEETPRLYQMLQNEESRTSRERKLEQNMKILNQKYLEQLQASRSLFSISVKLLNDFMQASPQSEEKIDDYKKSIGQYRRLVLEEGKPSEKKAPTSEQIQDLKENIMDLSKRIYNQVQLKKQQDPDKLNLGNDEDDGNEEILARQLKSELVKLRLLSLETGQQYRQDYLRNLIKLDVLDMGHIDKPNHYVIANLNNFEHFVKHQLIALISIICSLREGRLYILERDANNILIKLIIKIMKDQEKGSVTQRFCLAVLHKVSLHDELLPLLLEEKLHIWLVDLIKMSISNNNERDNKLHVFVLEYASATLSNLLSEEEVMQTFYGQQQNSVQFLDSLLKCLDDQNSVQANKHILRSLSFFTKDKFNQSILETSYDEKINQFLDSVSKNTDEDYKTQVLTYHARIFTTEVNKQGLDMEQKDEYERGMKKKYDNNDDSIDQGYDDPDQVIIFEHFIDELTDELLKGLYNR